MDYFLQMSAFEDWVEYHSLTAAEELLWYRLMAVNSKFGWSEWFFISNRQLMLKAHIDSESKFIRARNKLKRLELIDFIKANKGEPTRYKMFRLYGRDDCKFTAKCAETSIAEVAEQFEKKAVPRGADGTVKLVSRGEAEKVRYAEFVFMTEKEYNSLLGDERLGSADAVRRCIDILDNYKGSSGKRYKSDYRTILSWVVDRYLGEKDIRSVVKGQDMVPVKKSKKDEQKARYL
ncbi:hypothetical protein LJC10_06190, partial [Selenomonadales bacterium OttesenSCG-928-I06]|nr:hypothetical protein [Selenomonadales bacterium OttesenSCG-928-I06]